MNNFNTQKIDIIDLDKIQIKQFFLTQKAYSTINLPTYFKFENLLTTLDNVLQSKTINDIKNQNPSDFENINYKIYTNKNGKFDWRKLELLNPAIYVLLVNLVAKNWEGIKYRLQELKCERISACGLPVVGIENDEIINLTNFQIFNWWDTIEQESLRLSLKFRYFSQTDISDCYGSLYTHTIPWALDGKEQAKKNNREKIKTFADNIDYLIRQMTNNQTNGIPQGSVLMDLIAEIVLAYCDKELECRICFDIVDYQILRYRDDYRIFTNSLEDSEKILKHLNDILKESGFRLNEAKTQILDEIILNSVKKDKIYALSTHRFNASKLYKKALSVYDFSHKFPNSGSLINILNKFAKRCEKKENLSSNEVLTIISIIFAISENSPRYYAEIIRIISILIKFLDKNQKYELLRDIYAKLQKRPFTEFAEIWLQRLDRELEIDYESKICKCIKNGSNKLWENSWLKPEILEIFNQIPFIDMTEFMKLDNQISADEISENLYNLY